MGSVAESDVDFALRFDQNISKSCSLTWRGEFYIFGGDEESKRQILKLNGCTIETVGLLSFDYKLGGCGNSDDRNIYLCFNDYGKNPEDYKKCRKATNPLGPFSELPDTKYNHRRTQIGVSPGKFTKLYSQMKTSLLKILSLQLGQIGTPKTSK